MQEKFRRTREGLNTELDWWTKEVGKPLLRNKIDSLRLQFNNDVPSDEWHQGTLHYDEHEKDIGIIHRFILEDNPDRDITLLFLPDSELDVYDNYSECRVHICTSRKHLELIRENSIQVASKNDPYKDLAPHEQFEMAVRLLSLLVRAFEVKQTFPLSRDEEEEEEETETPSKLINFPS